MTVAHINQGSKYNSEGPMAYHVPGRTEESKLVEMNFFKHQKRGANSFTVNLLEKSYPRLHWLSKETSIMDIKRLVLDKMRGIFEEAPADDEALNQLIEVHVRENLPIQQTSKYVK